MKLYPAFCIAFSMYSKIPMPQVDWDKENIKYMMCFFPMVGIACGVGLVAIFYLAQLLGIKIILMSALALVLPIAITGGIHLDGFCDTVDGLSSNQSIEKKLEILKDPNAGAFAVIGCVCYLLLYFALFTQFPMEWKAIYIFAIGYVLSRSLSGYSVVTFTCAKNSGLVHAFSDGAAKEKVRVVMLIYIGLCITLMCIIDPIYGGATAIGSYIAFFYYKRMAYKEFGGITGDLAGFFLQISELFMLIALVLVGLLKA